MKEVLLDMPFWGMKFLFEGLGGVCEKVGEFGEWEERTRKAKEAQKEARRKSQNQSKSKK